jgi:glycine cleavage system H protein
VRFNEKKKEAQIGLTDHAIEQLSDLVHLEFPKVGDAVEQGAPFAEIESVKTVADLVSPLTGKVTAINSALSEDLSTLKDDPFEEGWIVRIKVSDPSEMDALMTKKEYEDLLEAAEEEESEKEDDEEVDEDDFV